MKIEAIKKELIKHISKNINNYEYSSNMFFNFINKLYNKNYFLNYDFNKINENFKNDFNLKNFLIYQKIDINNIINDIDEAILNNKGQL